VVQPRSLLVVIKRHLTRPSVTTAYARDWPCYCNSCGPQQLLSPAHTVSVLVTGCCHHSRTHNYWLGPLGPIYSGHSRTLGIRPTPAPIGSPTRAGCYAPIKKVGWDLAGLLLSHDSRVSLRFFQNIQFMFLVDFFIIASVIFKRACSITADSLSVPYVLSIAHPARKATPKYCI